MTNYAVMANGAAAAIISADYFAVDSGALVFYVNHGSLGTTVAAFREWDSVQPQPATVASINSVNVTIGDQQFKGVINKVVDEKFSAAARSVSSQRG